jgi:hypothetical protein
VRLVHQLHGPQGAATLQHDVPRRRHAAAVPARWRAGPRHERGRQLQQLHDGAAGFGDRDRRRHPVRDRVAGRLRCDHGIQGARIAGASTIVAVDLFERKRELALQFGATAACSPEDLDALKDELTGDGFDYAIEVIGLAKTMRAAWDAVHRGGTACVVGAGSPDDHFELSALEIFFNEKTLVGSYYGSSDVRSDFHRLLRLWRSGQLDLEGMISRRSGIDDINEAFEAMVAGETIRTVISF